MSQQFKLMGRLERWLSSSVSSPTWWLTVGCVCSVPEDLMPTSDLHATAYMYCVDMHAGKPPPIHTM